MTKPASRRDGKPYGAKRRSSRQAAVLVRMSQEEREALHRIAARNGTNVNVWLLQKVAPDLRREMRALESK